MTPCSAFLSSDRRHHSLVGSKALPTHTHRPTHTHAHKGRPTQAHTHTQTHTFKHTHIDKSRQTTWMSTCPVLHMSCVTTIQNRTLCTAVSTAGESLVTCAQVRSSPSPLQLQLNLFFFFCTKPQPLLQHHTVSSGGL